jgi:hypothetical protein
MAKQFIVLHGLANSGKTTTLRHTIETLTGFTLPTTSINYRVVFDFQGETIAISTFGDDKPSIQKNLDFFDGILSPRTTIYRIKNHQSYELSADELRELDVTICISACRINDSKNIGNVRLIENYIKKNNLCSVSQWFYKSPTGGTAMTPSQDDILTSLRIINSINK